MEPLLPPSKLIMLRLLFTHLVSKSMGPALLPGYLGCKNMRENEVTPRKGSEKLKSGTPLCHIPDGFPEPKGPLLKFHLNEKSVFDFHV